MGIHQYIIDGDPASLEQPDSTFEDGLAQQVLPPGLDLDNPLDRGPLELDDDLAPLVVPEDLELEDLAWRRGNDWMTETQRLEDVYGVRRLFR